MAKTANQIVTDNLSRWMTASKTLKSQSALHRVSKVAQSHISRIIRGEGPDTTNNMQWQTVAEAKAKDRWERQGCEHP